MDAFQIVVIAVLAVAAYSIVRRVRRVTVHEYERGLRFHRGRLGDVLGPGRYWLIGAGVRIDVVDIRPRTVTVPAQEVLSKDGVSIKMSLLVRFRVLDPRKALMSAESYGDQLYASAQVALRELVSGGTMDEILSHRGDIDARLVDAVRPGADELGVELLSISIKDIMFPGPLKEAFAQTARAKQEGMARLERARGESAALRNLANASRMMDANPRLYELRLLHALIETKGSLVVHTGPGASAAGPELEPSDDD